MIAIVSPRPPGTSFKPGSSLYPTVATVVSVMYRHSPSCQRPWPSNRYPSAPPRIRNVRVARATSMRRISALMPANLISARPDQVLQRGHELRVAELEAGLFEPPRHHPLPGEQDVRRALADEELHRERRHAQPSRAIEHDRNAVRQLLHRDRA